MSESVNVRIRLDDDQMAALRGQVRQVAEHYAGELERLRFRLRETEADLKEAEDAMNVCARCGAAIEAEYSGTTEEANGG